MQQRTLIIGLVISSLFIFLHGSIDNDVSDDDDDNIDLYEILQQRTSLSFTEAQRNFQNEMLKAHNIYRAQHCAPSLKLDDDLNYSAQKYAESLATNNKLDHSTGTDVGENLCFFATSREIKNFNGATATGFWYDEIAHYNFDKAIFSEKTGHFTQVVWKSSKTMGAGYAIIKHNSLYKIYIVAHYSPPGNIAGLFSKNVLPRNC